MILNSFNWNDTNIEHIAEHGVTPDEVEEVFVSKYILLKTRSKRYIALGITATGRYLTVVFETLSQKESIRVITSRDMNYKERTLYRRKLKL